MTTPSQGVEVNHIEFPAGRIRFYQAGSSGPPIVLLHGGGLDNAMLSWRHAIPVLSVDHRVFVPDLPGHGGSFPWHGRANQRTLEEVLRWLLDAWHVQQAILVGLSIGASAAAGFTLRHPQRVHGLILVSPSGMQHRLDNHLLSYMALRAGFIGPMVARLVRLNRSFARWMLARTIFTGSQPVRDIEAILDETLDEARNRGSVFNDWLSDAIGRKSMRVNHLPHLGQIRCPTMVIHGEQDSTTPMSAAREAAGAIIGSSLRVVPDAGHWLNREKPAEFNALLREFVNTHG